jgi:hypothetical protein
VSGANETVCLRLFLEFLYEADFRSF